MDAQLIFPDKKLPDFDRLVRELEDELEQACEDIGQRFASEIGDNAPEHTGSLANSFTYDFVVDQTEMKLTIGSNKKHAAPQEFGTDPFFPPPSELRDWAAAVLGDESAAYPVAHHISENGIEEKEYMKTAWEDNTDWAIKRLDKAVERAAKKVI